MTTATERWAEIAACFDELVELDPSAREARLAQLGEDDAAIAAEVRSLLAADDADNPLLESDAAAAIPGLLGDHDSGPGDGMAGPYRLLRSIGEGGMGEVWLAERMDGAYEQQVAVKLLKRGMDTHAILRRFLQERRILARLSHPHIVRLIDGGMSSDGRPFYVMDHVDGQPITHYAAEHALDVRARVALLADIADAVAYAHTQLVVHRDLKPSNILVDYEGKPRVLDFGIAKLIEESGEQTLTGTGLRVLSPAYAAPEQILGEAIGTTTDVYALGLMLCELLTGQLPQRRSHSSPAQLALDASQEIVDRASTLATRIKPDQLRALYGSDIESRHLSRRLSGDLDLIIATALQRNPSRRYPTAAVLAEDLRRWLEGRPISARADSTSYRFYRFVRRHRVGVAATALIAISLVGGLGAALYQAGEAQEQASLAQQQAVRAERVKTFLIDIFKQSDPEIAKGEPLSASEILKQGRSALESSLTDDPATRGELLMAIAEIQANLGQRDDGMATVEKAFPLFSSHLANDDPRLAHAYFIRATLYDYANRPVDAERDLLAAQRIIQSTQKPDFDQLDQIQALLIEVVNHTRSKSEAVALQKQLLERIKRRLGSSGTDYAKARSNLARLQEESGDYAGADQGYKEIMPILSSINGGLTPGACEAEANYAGLLDRMSRPDEALPHFDRAQQCQEALFGKNSIQYARSLFSRGILKLNLRRYAEAEEDFRATLPIYADHGIDAGHARRYLGRALFEKGNYSAAADEFKAAERIYREVNMPNDFQRWRARADYGYALFRIGDISGGRNAVEAGLAGLREEIPEADTPEFMRPLRALVEISRVQGRPSEALAASRRWYALAIQNYGADSRDTYKAGFELACDLAIKGDRASLVEAQSLLVNAIRLGKQFDEPGLEEYEVQQRQVERAIRGL